MFCYFNTPKVTVMSPVSLSSLLAIALTMPALAKEVPSLDLRLVDSIVAAAFPNRQELPWTG